LGQPPQSDESRSSHLALDKENPENKKSGGENGE